jgi:glycosyltransferase involved in cell wall biosynthesis
MILPKISIITPTFNSSKYLEDTIKSIISQNYPNLEYIVIDGGSTDGTVDIIRKYSDFIAFWISEPDNGMYDAINKGFQRSTGEIMAWINSDDLYHTGSLSNVANIFNDISDIEWIIGKSCLFNSEGLCVKMNDAQYWSKNRLLSMDYRWIQQENVFWRRSLWVKAGAEMNLNFKLAGDFELWNRFFNYSCLHSVQTSFAGFRLHGQQLSILQSKQYEDEVAQINKGNKGNSIRIFLGKVLFSAIKRIGERKNSILLTIKIFFQLILNRLNNYPSVIYYDFLENKWTN